MTVRGIVGVALGPRARRDSLLLAVGRVAAALLSFVWLLVIARHLGPAPFGRLMTLLSLAAIVGVVHDGGHQFALTETVARDVGSIRPASRLVIRRRLLLASGAAVSVVIFYAATFDGEVAPAVIFAASILGTAVYSSVTAGLRGAETIAPDAANEVLSRLFILGVGVPLLLSGGGLLAVVVAYGVTELVSAIALLMVLRTWLRRRGVPPQSSAFDPSGFRWSRLWPLAAALAVGTISYRVDMWMVALLRDDAEVGVYAAAYRLLEGLLIPAGAIATARLASIVRSPDTELPRRLTRLCAATVAVTGLPAIVLALTAPFVLRLTFGSAFADSTSVLRLLLAGSIASAAVVVVVPAISARSRTGSLVISLTSALANIGLNALFIPGRGAQGAAIASLITQGVTLVAAVVVLRRLLVRSQDPSAKEGPRIESPIGPGSSASSADRGTS